MYVVYMIASVILVMILLLLILCGICRKKKNKISKHFIELDTNVQEDDEYMFQDVNRNRNSYSRKTVPLLSEK